MWIESYEHQLHPGLLWKGRDLSAQHVTRYPQIHWSLLAFSCLSWYVVKHTNCIYLVRIVSPLYIGYHKPSNNLVLCSVVVYIYNYIYNVIYLWPRTLSLWQCRKNSDERLESRDFKMYCFQTNPSYSYKIYPHYISIMPPCWPKPMFVGIWNIFWLYPSWVLFCWPKPMFDGSLSNQRNNTFFWDVLPHGQTHQMDIVT